MHRHCHLHCSNNRSLLVGEVVGKDARAQITVPAGQVTYAVRLNGLVQRSEAKNNAAGFQCSPLVTRIAPFEVYTTSEIRARRLNLHLVVLARTLTQINRDLARFRTYTRLIEDPSSYL